MKKTLLTVFVVLFLGFAANAQDKTPSLDELKAERAALLALSKSQNFLDDLAKSDKLTAPKSIGVGGVDAVTDALSVMLQQLRENRATIPQIYSSVTGETVEGTAAVNVKPVTADQLLTFSKMFMQMGQTLIKSSTELTSLPGEIKSAGPMKILKSVKSLAYIKNAISALKQELTYNSKMVNNLIATQNLQAAKK